MTEAELRIVVRRVVAMHYPYSFMDVQLYKECDRKWPCKTKKQLEDALRNESGVPTNGAAVG